MNIKFKTVIVQIGVVVMMLFTIGGMFLMNTFSFEVARANPELAHMRVPVLSLGILFLFLILIILVIAFLFLRRIQRGNVFEMRSVKNLQAMGWVALATILPLVALYVYTEKNVSGSITNLYVTVAVLMMGVIAVFFFLIANLFEQAVHYKEENDLTV